MQGTLNIDSHYTSKWFSKGLAMWLRSSRASLACVKPWVHIAHKPQQHTSQVWRCMLVVPALGWWRQEDYSQLHRTFRASLRYIRLCLKYVFKGVYYSNSRMSQDDRGFLDLDIFFAVWLLLAFITRQVTSCGQLCTLLTPWVCSRDQIAVWKGVYTIIGYRCHTRQRSLSFLETVV